MSKGSSAARDLNRAYAEPRPTPADSKAMAPEALGPETLGPGLHGGRIELIADDVVAVRMTDGRRLEASIGDHVEPELIAECLREGRMVVLADGARGPTVVGALQTTRALSATRDGCIELDAKEIRLRAARRLVLEAGDTALRAERNGVVRIEGEKMLLDLSSLVRFLSARVELP